MRGSGAAAPRAAGVRRWVLGCERGRSERSCALRQRPRRCEGSRGSRCPRGDVACALPGVKPEQPPRGPSRSPPCSSPGVYLWPPVPAALPERAALPHCPRRSLPELLLCQTGTSCRSFLTAPFSSALAVPLCPRDICNSALNAG